MAMLSTNNRRTGAAAIEFAMVAPAVFMVIFGIIEIGRAFMVAHIAGEIARRSCRAAIVARGTTTFDNITTTYIDPMLATYGLPSRSAGTVVNYYVTAWGNSFNSTSDLQSSTNTSTVAIINLANSVSPGSAGTNNYTPGDEIMVQVNLPINRCLWMGHYFTNQNHYISGQYTLRKE
jgi:Flp pilus assembly protein TadG